MPFTLITITADDVAPDGQPANGSVTAILSGPMQNGTEVIPPAPIRGMLINGALFDDSGEQPFQLEANDDTATTPTGRWYEFTIELDGAPLLTGSAQVPHAAPGATIDLSVLVPS